MKEYKKIAIRIVDLLNKDIITLSQGSDGDHFGMYPEDWDH